MKILLFAGLDFLLLPGDPKILEGRKSGAYMTVEEPQRITCSDGCSITVPRTEHT